MTRRRVLIELREPIHPTRGAMTARGLDGIQLDSNYGMVTVPASERVDRSIPGFNESFHLNDTEEGAETYLVRGEIDDEQVDVRAAAGNDQVIGVYADVAIQPLITCIGSPPLGDDKRVEELLNVPRLKAFGLTGADVLVAVVDTGINLAYLKSKGKNPRFDKGNSWVPRSGLEPGQLPVGHGTMCAYDVCIAAPQCTLLDIAVLLSNAPGGSVMEGLLSDAVKAYDHLRQVLRRVRPKGLVVSNSWGMFHPSWDFPVGHPGNFSHNLNHPFNRIVATLEREGADVLFAAGNCGNECPDSRCGGVANVIYGANSHPRVLSVAGVDVEKNRVGYSTKGPGALTPNKPDLAGYTHFKGSGVFPADSGTSAATPVVAGVVAAVRTKLRFRPAVPTTWPKAVRLLLTRTAEDRGTPGFDREYGWGVVNVARVLPALAASEPSVKEPSAAEPERPVPAERVLALLEELKTLLTVSASAAKPGFGEEPTDNGDAPLAYAGAHEGDAGR